MTYDYQCPTCGLVKEVIHRMDEEPLILCPKIGCGNLTTGYEGTEYFRGTSMTRMISENVAGGFVLKGSGWYAKDSKTIKTASEVHGTGLVTDARGKAK